MASNLSKTTRDQEEIRRWAEERGGKPAHVKHTGSGEDPGLLRIEFPGYGSEQSLEPISWDEWFAKFDEGDLAFLYEDRKADGELSTFNKIVSAQSAAQNERGRRSGSKTSSKRGGAKKATASKKAPASKGRKAIKKAAKAVTKKGGAKKASKKAISKGPRKAAKKATSRGAASKKSSKRPAAKKSASKKRR